MHLGVDGFGPDFDRSLEIRQSSARCLIELTETTALGELLDDVFSKFRGVLLLWLGRDGEGSRSNLKRLSR